MAEYYATKEGLFHKGTKIALEFGNPEHIKAVRKYEKTIRLLETEGGMQIEPEYIRKAEGNFPCSCGRNVYYDIDINDFAEDDTDCFLEQEVTCHGCGNVYEFLVNDDYDVFVKRVYKEKE